MNIDEAKKERQLMQDQIKRIINDFEDNTGLVVESISLIHMETIAGSKNVVLVDSSVSLSR